MAKDSDMLKVIIIGDSGVGKTALRAHYIHQKFSKTKQTIGSDFISKAVDIAAGDARTDGKKRVQLQLWDTSGQERFQSITAAYYRGADAAVLVYDVSNPTSLANLAIWQRDFVYQAKIDDPASFPFFVVANKVDLPRGISTAQGKKASQILHDIACEMGEEGSQFRRETLPQPSKTNPAPAAGFLGAKSIQTRLKGLEADHELEFFPRFKPTLSNKASVLSFHTARSELDASDLPHSRRNSVAQSDHTAADVDDGDPAYPYFECSAVTGEGIDAAFYHIALSVESPSSSPFTSVAIDYETRDDTPRGAPLFVDNPSRCC
ncbi:hypothetical protein HDV03_000935 [Kappamyces sp. JEL0829]|nr:hypothetical protein HDV03_000935 [Kappamyces sp. JEL0829]